MSRGLVWVAVVGLLVNGALAHCADKGALIQRLHNAAENSSIDDPALKPWHLKTTFQIFDAKGLATEEGTIEEWWSAGNDKRVFTSSLTPRRRSGRARFFIGLKANHLLLTRSNCFVTRSYIRLQRAQK